MVGPDGLEPSTPRLSSACSNQLSYEPGERRICRRGRAWSRPDLNRRPPACKAGALPAELRPHRPKIVLYKELLFKSYFVRSTRTPSSACPRLAAWTGRDSDHRSRTPRRAGDRLLRKEVIQPQVPLRLPCYDFVPITSLTLGRRPPCGLTNALRAKPAFMT
jgi:hypothetical protein